ncbi:MAG: class I SAM-dependent methyltransferase [Rhodospirillales bacterium]|tara:strand:- start:1329 stop:2225 length:897 start_codon:yes stop_codon:yes gene_type:complete
MTDRKYGKTTADLGFMSVTPMPSRAELEKFYAETYFQTSAAMTYAPTYSPEELDQKRLRARLVLHAITATGRVTALNDARLLEVGCGEGFILQAATEAGCMTTGVDYSEHAIRSFHPDLLPNLRLGDAATVLDNLRDSGETFDVCVLQNVVEHVIDPFDLLAKVRAVMAKDGILLVNVPNDYSPMQTRLQELGWINREYWFSPPDHLHYFNVDNIGGVADRAGFQVVDMFGDFPIELFLFHPGSNYVQDSGKGADAHRARIILDLLLAERGLDAYHDFCRAMSRCGIGRNLCAVMAFK